MTSLLQPSTLAHNTWTVKNNPSNQQERTSMIVISPNTVKNSFYQLHSYLAIIVLDVVYASHRIPQYIRAGCLVYMTLAAHQLVASHITCGHVAHATPPVLQQVATDITSQSSPISSLTFTCHHSFSQQMRHSPSPYLGTSLFPLSEQWPRNHPNPENN